MQYESILKKTIEPLDPEFIKLGLKEISSLTINRVITDNKNTLHRYETEFFKISNIWQTTFNAVCNNFDVPNLAAINTLHELIKEKKKRIIFTGHGGCGKSTIMIRTAIEEAQKGRTVFWLDMCENNADVKSYDTMIDFIHRCGEPKRQALLFIDNPYLGRECLLDLKKAFAGKEKNIQVIMTDRIQRLYELTYENSDYLRNWFENPDIFLMIPYNDSSENYEFLIEVFEDFSINQHSEICYLNIEMKWISNVLKHIFSNVLKIYSEDKINRIINNIMQEYDAYNISLVEFLYHIMFRYLKKFHKRASKDISMDWDEWADRLMQWNITQDNDSLEYYLLIAAFGCFNLELDIKTYASHYCFLEKKNRLINKLKIMIGKYNIEPICFNSQMGTISAKNDIICDLFFLFNQRLSNGINILFPYIDTMSVTQLQNLIDNLYIKIRIVESTQAYYNWDELIEKIQKSSTFKHLKSKKCKKRIVQCIFWSHINRHEFYEAYSYMKEQLYNEDLKDDVVLLNDFARICNSIELFPEAEKTLKHILEINPCHIQSMISLAKLYMYNKNYSECKYLLNDILLINPRSVAAIVMMAKLYDINEIPDKAEEQFEHAYECNPKDITMLYEYGKHFMKKGDIVNAKSKFYEILEVKRNDKYALQALAEIFVKSKNISKAERFYKRTLYYNRLDVNALVGLRDIYLSFGNPEIALKMYKQLAINNRNNSNFYFEFGRLYELLDNFDKAQYMFKKALQINPLNFMALNALLSIYSNNNMADAEKLLYNTYKKFRYNTKVIIMYVRFLNENGKFDEAERVLKEAKDNNPETDELSIELSVFYARTDRLNSAVSNLRIKRKVEENSHILLNNQNDPLTVDDAISIGNLYLEMNRGNEAYNLYQNAIKKFGVNTELLVGLSKSSILLDDIDSAIEYIERAIKFQPDNYALKAFLAELYIKTNNISKMENLLLNVNNIEPKSSIPLNKIKDRHIKKHLNKPLVQIEQNESFDKETNKSISEIIKNCKSQDAIRILQTFISKYPDKIYLRNELAELYLKNGIYDKADQILQNTLKTYNRPLSTLILYGRTQYNNGNIKEAISIYREIVFADPDNNSMRISLALLLRKNNNTDEALDILSKGAYTRDTGICYHLVNMYYKSGKNIEACTILNAFINENNHNFNRLISVLDVIRKNKLIYDVRRLLKLIRNCIQTENDKKSLC